MKMKRLQIGDVLEVSLPGGFAYLLYIGKHFEYGDAVAVCPTVTTQPASETETLFEKSYVAFYPAHAALAQGLVAVVGRIATRPMPRLLRRPGARSEGKVEAWIIEDGSNETLKWNLSEIEQRIPIATIWNHELLLQRIAEGWRPEREI